MNQEYVLYFRDVSETGMVDSLPQLIPEAKILERRGQLVLIESPIHSEAALYDYFAHANCALTRKRTYQLLGCDMDENQKLILDLQEELIHPVNQVYFRAGLLACREYMARFIENDSPIHAASIRANWWPSLGQDFGPPRQLGWDEMTVGEYGDKDFRAKTADEISPTQEALPVALQFLLSLDPGSAIIAATEAK